MATEIFSFCVCDAASIDASGMKHTILSRSVRDRDHWEVRMPSLPQIDSACRFTGAILLGLAISCGGAPAEDLTPARIKAATGAVDGAFIKGNTASSNDWPTIGLDYAETRFSRLSQITSDNVKG